jgi:hypothetical protein
MGKIVVKADRNVQASVPTTLVNGEYGLIHNGKIYWYEVTNDGKNIEFFTNSYLANIHQDPSIPGYWNASPQVSSGFPESAADNWFPPDGTFAPGTIVRLEEVETETKADGTLSKFKKDSNGNYKFAQVKTRIEADLTNLFTGKSIYLKRDSDYFSIANALNYSKVFGTFNPPPHKSSRTIAPTAFPNLKLGTGANDTTIANLQKVNKRGFFYQDIDTAFDGDGKKKIRGHLWGFQFMYNPTTISYTNSVSTSIDWSNSQDVATALAGSQQFTFSLFLNRLADVSSLKSFQTTTLSKTNRESALDNPLNYIATGTSGSYERDLTAMDANGIVTRGTEYDLEYFYRVINGDPAYGSSMLQPTADFGFMSGVPVWLKFNDHVRYKVTVQSISVNHVMFTEDMVPVVTEVQLSMIRIPTPKQGSTADVQAWYDQQFGIKKGTTWPGMPINTATDTTTP